MEEKYRTGRGWCWDRGSRVVFWYSLGWLWLGMAELLVVHGPLILHCTLYRPVWDVNQQEEETEFGYKYKTRGEIASCSVLSPAV